EHVEDAGGEGAEPPDAEEDRAPVVLAPGEREERARHAVEGEPGDREDVGAHVGDAPHVPLDRPGEGAADSLREHETRAPIMQSLALKEKLETLPTQPGVYLFKDGEGSVLYVGKARVLRDRVRQYFQPGRPADVWRDALVTEIADLDMVLTDTEMEALALEN